MTPYYYDFHIHSCLSPCAENDMTPNNIAGMGKLAGLDIMALTDHNACKNCPAFFEAAKGFEIVPIAGMELTTAEDIHVVCLFETLEGALDFDDYVENHRMRIPNNTAVYGEQLILDANDEVIGNEPFFLLPATDIMIEDVPKLVKSRGGISYPAHVDREANGVIATLGTFPEIKGFRCAEFYDAAKQNEYLKTYPILKEKRVLVSSDAHNLWSIRDKAAFIELPDGLESPEDIRKAVFRFLRGE